jgi:TPR repeat protein
MTLGRILVLCMAVSGVASNAMAADPSDDGDRAFENHDYPKAVRLLMPLAQQGNMIAELDIGLMYFGGNGLAQDDREAARLFLAAAQQGNFGAQTDIGIAYATGRGIPQDRVQAYMWFSVAASQQAATGHTMSANYRDHIATELTPDQLQIAQDLAKACQAANYKNCGTP